MLTYSFEQRGSIPKYDHLYQQIRSDIANGTLSPGERLPSKRTLAEHLGVSITTVENAYGLLAAEGYIHAVERSGFFVSRLELPNGNGSTGSTPKPLPLPDPLPPAENGFRFSTLTKIMREVISKHHDALLQPSVNMGCAVLRNAIAAYLLRYRGMTVKPEQIVIGAGSEYLYGSVVQLFGRDMIYGLEDPAYEKIRAVYNAHGAQCDLLPLDANGIREDALAATNANVLHVTPFHSYPSGATAPAAKRYSYLSWARSRGAWLIEDDFDSEFSLGRKPLQTLFSMDTSDSVVYLNTFSKSLAPSMRIGYMILPERLLEQYHQRLGFYSCPVPVFDQYVLAEYIEQGHFERHLNRIRRKLRQQHADSQSNSQEDSK